jgi:hypothetical protein
VAPGTGVVVPCGAVVPAGGVAPVGVVVPCRVVVTGASDPPGGDAARSETSNLVGLEWAGWDGDLGGTPVASDVGAASPARAIRAEVNPRHRPRIRRRAITSSP